MHKKLVFNYYLARFWIRFSELCKKICVPKWLPDFSFFNYQKSATDILFITLEKRLHMFISCVNRLMPGGSNKSYSLKPSCKFYLHVSKHLWPFLPPGIKELNARRYFSFDVSMQSFWKTSHSTFFCCTVS